MLTEGQVRKLLEIGQQQLRELLGPKHASCYLRRDKGTWDSLIPPDRQTRLQHREHQRLQ